MSINYHAYGMLTVLSSFLKTNMQIIEQKTKAHRLVRNLKIDMTPMVDLGFLLISFFIFTTTMGGDNAMKLYMPTDREGGELKSSHAFTILLTGNDKVMLFTGDAETALRSNSVIHTNYNTVTGIGKYLREKISEMRSNGGDPTDLMVLIKPTDKCSYKNIIDALDEMTVNGVRRYAIVDTKEKAETELIEKH
jgi:biopolymer transport protein ExbD